jgi:anti-sigma factor RsiW
MACDTWGGKLDLYVDGELDSANARDLGMHLRGCAACAADALQRVQMKRSIAAAGKRYEPSAHLRAKITKSVAAKPGWRISGAWTLIAIPALLVMIASVAVNFYVERGRTQRYRVYSELADVHVSALASTTPVDVISTDRHTVKPWFQGKIPFTFNLPELQGTEFTLVGGRVTYLAQTPGAHLIYQVRKHEVSVFIFQDRGVEPIPSGRVNALSFNVENWTQNGLHYFVIGDVDAEDIRTLSKLLQNAG